MNVVINNNIFKVIPLFTSKDIQQGMMRKKFDGSFDGMLFFMDKGPHSFWMKNCLVSLDIIFIDGKKINVIQHQCKPCKTEECPSYEGYGDLVLELPGGTCEKYNINDGDFIYFE